ncbi:iron-sulfur cluster assembly enzyme ISCU, mitochondrial [Batrachochytrium salamandrivorans]|nr:iron-sulfur cluster assembly enzyme ISCU, mitochondrial [Batrachochytrium salamandrivorans]
MTVAVCDEIAKPLVVVSTKRNKTKRETHQSLPCLLSAVPSSFAQLGKPARRTRPWSSLDKKKLSVGTGLVGAPACGDVMKLQIEVDANGIIQESKFKTFGCGSAIASSSVATEWVKGKSVEEVLKIKNTDIAKHLNLPPVKLHCSMLAEDAIKAAVQDWKTKNASPNSDPNPTSNNNNTFDCAMQRVNQMISMTAQALDLEIHTVLEHIANLKRSF